MDDKYTEREKEILNGWPAVTEEDLIRMNDLFPHYLFFCREGALMGLGGVKLYASCCGHKEYRPYLVRTEEPEHRDLLDHLKHRVEWTCPWCGRSVTVIDLARAKGRKSLVRYETTVLLHSRGEALYADALVLCKDYADEAALIARPTAWCSSGYRFVRGEVMQADHQVYYGDERPFISYEREKLSRRKLVQEPFKKGSISWYTYEPYSILNREALQNHPFFRYCGFFLAVAVPAHGRQRLRLLLSRFDFLPDRLRHLPQAGGDAGQVGLLSAAGRYGLFQKEKCGLHELGGDRSQAGF